MTKDTTTIPAHHIAAPKCDKEELVPMAGGGSAKAQWYMYKAPATHTMLDILEPGYFTPGLDRGLHPWNRIDVDLGDDPRDGAHMVLRVAEARHSGTDSLVTVTILERNAKPTHCGVTRVKAEAA